MMNRSVMALASEVFACKEIPVIGITGKARHGKDTVAELLELKYQFKKLAVADPLKQSASILYGVPLQYFYNPGLKEKVIPRLGKSPRQIMQEYGDALRSIPGESVIVQNLRHRINNILLNPGDCCGIVVSDCRYANEVSVINEFAGNEIWKIDATARLDQCGGNGLDDSTKNHSSESGVPLSFIDRIITNNGSLEELMKAVDCEMSA